MELSGVKNISKTYGSGGAGKHALKSYLSLIPISAKVHRRQNRMTLLCIIFAVFMVTAVFSMAEMSARMEQTRLLEKHGSLSFAELFQSELGQAFILTAGGVFVLILIAGVLMISSSINSSIAQRVKFFGMMRCIGMSRRQIIRFVRLEALNWCKTAVPIGLVLGIIASWGLCAALRFLVGEEFSNIPLFGFSIIGIVSGIVVGVVTVLLAARAPARRAAKVSPAAAGTASSCKSPFGQNRDGAGHSSRCFRQEKPVPHDGLLCPQHYSVFMFFRSDRFCQLCYAAVGGGF